MLRDNFNRVINYLRVSVTDRCNLHCRYCSDKDLPFTPHDDILRYEEILRFVRIAATLGVQKVRLTGGEPLSRRGITFLIGEINSIEGITDISLTTNGVYLGERVTELKEAGLGRVNISLDTLKRDRFSYITGVDVFDRVIASIEKAKELGLEPIKINTVIIKGFNDDEILDFARLTLENPYQIRFIELMPLGHAGIENNGRYLSNAIVRERIETFGRLDPVSGRGNGNDGPAQIYRLAGGAGEIGFISPVSRHFCRTCNRLRLTADGHLRACLLSDDETDLKGPLREGCADEEIQELIRRAISRKPERHGIACSESRIKKCMKEMQEIGG